MVHRNLDLVLNCHLVQVPTFFVGEASLDEPSIAFIRAIAFLFNARQIALSDSKGELDGRKAMTSNLANVFENMKDGLKDKRQWLKPGQKIQFEQSQEYAKLLGQQRL